MITIHNSIHCHYLVLISTLGMEADCTDIKNSISGLFHNDLIINYTKAARISLDRTVYCVNVYVARSPCSNLCGSDTSLNMTVYENRKTLCFVSSIRDIQ